MKAMPTNGIADSTLTHVAGSPGELIF